MKRLFIVLLFMVMALPACTVRKFDTAIRNASYSVAATEAVVAVAKPIVQAELEGCDRMRANLVFQQIDLLILGGKDLIGLMQLSLVELRAAKKTHGSNSPEATEALQDLLDSQAKWFQFAEKIAGILSVGLATADLYRDLPQWLDYVLVFVTGFAGINQPPDAMDWSTLPAECRP